MSGARRKRAGSGWRYTIDGEPVDSVTKVVREGIPKGGLIDWAARAAAGYAIDHWDELGEQTPSKRFDQLRKAPNMERDAAAGRGSKIHELADRLAHGEELTVPDALLGHVDAYLAFVADYNVRELHVETTCVYRGASALTSYMGTVDLLATLDGTDEVWLLDWKTGAGGIWPETALQLSAYAHAQTILVGDGPDEQPMPALARAAAVWLRADGYDVVPVDTSTGTWRSFMYAQQIARFCNAERAAYVGEALQPRQAAAS